MEKILKNLENYKKFWTTHTPNEPNLPIYLRNSQPKEEIQLIKQFDALVQKGKERIFDRDYFIPGHVTASVMLVDPTFTKYLLTHHKKLEKWLQLGGHADGEQSPEATALQEAKEESGVNHISILPSSNLLPEMPNPLPIDLDIHDIPAFRNDPAHQHFDFRFLALCHKPDEILCSDESHDIAWFSFDKNDYSHLKEPSLNRLVEKAKAFKEHLLDLPAEFLLATNKKKP